MSVYLELTAQDYSRLIKIVSQYERNLDKSRKRVGVVNGWAAPINLKIMEKPIFHHSSINIVDDDEVGRDSVVNNNANRDPNNNSPDSNRENQVNANIRVNSDIEVSDTSQVRAEANEIELLIKVGLHKDRVNEKTRKDMNDLERLADRLDIVLQSQLYKNIDDKDISISALVNPKYVTISK